MKETDSLYIRNLDTRTAHRFRVLAAELRLSQTETFEWLMVKAGVKAASLVGAVPAADKGK